MKSMKYAIAGKLISSPKLRDFVLRVISDEMKNTNSNISSFIWMKLTEAILIVPPFDRGILIDVLATGMPL